MPSANGHNGRTGDATASPGEQQPRPTSRSARRTREHIRRIREQQYASGPVEPPVLWSSAGSSRRPSRNAFEGKPQDGNWSD